MINKFITENKKVVIFITAIFSVLAAIANIDGSISFFNRILGVNPATISKFFEVFRMVVNVLYPIIILFVVIAFYKFQKQKNQAYQNVQDEFEEHKKETTAQFDKLNSELQASKNLVNLINENTATDMRIFRDIILPEYYHDQAAVNRIVTKLYNYSFNVKQLEQYGLDRTLLDAFRLHINNQEIDYINKNNPSAGRILNNPTA
jgi:hypothetical protein